MREGQPNPIEILAKVSAVAAKTCMDQRGAVMENPEVRSLPGKVKVRIGIGVAAALQSSTCTRMWVQHARKAGATDAEIAEAILVSRWMKAATVNDTAADAWPWLLDHPAAAGRG